MALLASIISSILIVNQPTTRRYRLAMVSGRQSGQIVGSLLLRRLSLVLQLNDDAAANTMLMLIGLDLINVLLIGASSSLSWQVNDRPAAAVVVVVIVLSIYSYFFFHCGK